MAKEPCVYMVTNKPNGTLYTGVTSNLALRIAQHKAGTYKGFSGKYGTVMLVWYEPHSTMERAIEREKQIKRYKRTWKLRLVNVLNPAWSDLYDTLFQN